MKNQLASTLQTGLIQGKNPRAIAGELRRYWYGNDPRTGKGAVYCMERLMRTELARVQTAAQHQSFETNGFEEYTFHTNTGCCDICAKLDGKHFKVKDMQPGLNAAPMHPNCRCSVSAYEDSEEYENWIDFLANGGTTEEYNRLKAKKQTGGKISGGKWYAPNNTENPRDVAAAKAYRKISRRNDTNTISKNTGIAVEDIIEIKRHIFFDKHQKYDGYGLLDPDYDMAVAWERLYNGNFLPRDITLLNHELLESKYEKMYNVTIAEAHSMAEKEYDWWKQVVDELGEDGEKDGLL